MMSIIWEDYDFVQPLGSGSFGVVREVKCKRTKHRYAAKTVPVTSDNERLVMSNLGHQHIVRLEQVIMDGGEMHLLLSLCSGGDLQNWIQDRWEEEFVTKQKFYDSPGNRETAGLARQMLSAVKYIHEVQIAHRDIKPSNWLIGAKSFFPVLKLSDFGLALKFLPGEPMTQTCGSFVYMAPEVFERSYSELCDVWSLGLTIHEIVCGTPYFSDVVESKVEHLVCSFAIKLDQMEWQRHKPWLQLWVQEMLCREKDGRPTAASSLEHPEVKRALGQRCNCSLS